jgi:hypothetical protein
MDHRGRGVRSRRRIPGWRRGSRAWYVLEVPSNTMGWTRLPHVEQAGTVAVSGHTLKQSRLLEGERSAREVSKPGLLGRSDARAAGKNLWWTVCQGRKAVEVQLDPTQKRPEIARRLEQMAFKIEYWQRRAEQAARLHRKRRRRDLRRAGIDLRRAIRFPAGF